MKLKSRIRYVFSNIIFNKKYYLFIILLSICFFLLNFSLSFFKTYNILLSDIRNEFNTRVYFISYDNYENRSSSEVFEYINDVKHVVAVYPKDYFEVSVLLQNIDNKVVNGNIILYGLNEKTSPRIVNGRELLNSGEIICPVNFYPFDEVENGLSNSDLINLNKYLNKDILVEINDRKKTMRLVGLYQNSYTSYDERNCYVHFDDISYLKELNESNVKIYDSDDGSFNPPKLIIDDNKNLSYVEKELMKEDIYISGSYIPNTSTEAFITILFLFLISVILSFVFILLIFVINRIVKKDKTNISLLKVFGFSNDEVLKIVFCELIIINLVSLLISFVFSLLVVILYKLVIYFKPFYFGKILFFFEYISIPFSLIIIIILSILTIIIFKKDLKKINIIEVLRD